MTGGFIASKASTMTTSHSHQGSQSQNDSPMLAGETKPLDEIADNALKHTENSESAGLVAKQELRKIVENDDFLKDYQEASQYNVRVKKPLYEEDEQENRDKIDNAITKANDKLRK